MVYGDDPVPFISRFRLGETTMRPLLINAECWRRMNPKSDSRSAAYRSSSPIPSFSHLQKLQRGFISFFGCFAFGFIKLLLLLLLSCIIQQWLRGKLVEGAAAAGGRQCQEELYCSRIFGRWTLGKGKLFLRHTNTNLSSFSLSLLSRREPWPKKSNKFLQTV